MFWWMQNFMCSSAMSDYVRQISEVVDAIQQKLESGAAKTGVIVNPLQSLHMFRKFEAVSSALVEHRSFFLNPKWQSILKEFFRLVTDAHNIVEECEVQAGDCWLNVAFLQVDNEEGFATLLERLKSTISLILDDELVNAHQRISQTFQKLFASVCPPNKTAFKYDHEQLLVKLKDMVATRISLQQNNDSRSFRAVHHLIEKVNRILERNTSELHHLMKADEGSNIAEPEFCFITEDLPLIFKDSDIVGEGSSGKLYRMEWSGLECVIKKFGPAVREEEAKLLVSANHPNIVRVICCLQDSGGTPIGILTELMPMALDKFIKKMYHHDDDQDESDEFPPRSFTQDAIIDILWQIASAMKHLHQLGIVHLDLKPSNILVSPSRVPELARDGYVRVAKLTDFGCAKQIVDSNSMYFNTPNFGTTRYRAPDHMTSPKMIYPEKCDIYSFALVCSEVLTGQIPFPDMECGKMRFTVGKNKERPALPADCPQDLTTLIEKCWAHKPKDRPNPSQICDELLKVRARLLTHHIFRAPSRSARSSEALLGVSRRRHTVTNCDPIDLSTKRAKLQEFIKSMSARLPSPSSMSVKRPHDASIHYWCGDEAFTYQELYVATHGFHLQNKLATPKEHTCKYGDMYKGTLKDTITRVAVRKIPTTVIDVECIRRMSHIQHPNIAGLRGWCNNRENLLLVYEYMEKGNLKRMLQDNIEVMYLRWVVRRDILKGVASAVRYLHDDCGLVHQGVKASNVLLGWDNNPHLRDSGLALLVPQNPAKRGMSIAKKRGHLAPELWHYKEHTKETDVFSFGNLILEVVCGDVHPAHLLASSPSNDYNCQPRKSSGCCRRFLHDYVWESYTKHYSLGSLDLWVDKIADPRLHGDFEVADVQAVLMLGLWCCHPDLGMRPSTSVVHQLLSADRIYNSPPKYHFHGQKKCRRSCPPLARRPDFTKLYDQVPPKKPEVWYGQPGPPECSRSSKDHTHDDHVVPDNHRKGKANLDCPCLSISIALCVKYGNPPQDPRFA